MRQKHILVILLAFVASVLQAAQVNKNDALQKAERFVAGRQAAARGAAGQALSLQTVLDNPYYYVFNIGTDGGFVIVSGDDRTPEILGYSDQGSFDAQNIPDNMRAFLQGYADEIQHLPANVTATSRGVGQKKVVKTPIAPLIQTVWDQSEPYYNNLPTFYDNDKCLTGCVATAMAQVLYYLQYPSATTQVIPGYTINFNIGGNPYELTVPQVEVTTFAWNEMLPAYSGGETNDEKAAVAALMQCCGTSVEMEYKSYAYGGSSAYLSDIPNALKTYFNFGNSVQYRNRSLYSTKEWENIIYTELAAARPVLYGGKSSGGGHAFVCDGFDGDGYYHINWGWSGRHNGFFLLAALNPYDTSGAGASSKPDGYTMSQDAIIGLQKPSESYIPEEVRLAMHSFAYEGNETIERSNSNMPFSCSFNCLNNLTETYDVTCSFGVYNSNNERVLTFGEMNLNGWDNWKRLQIKGMVGTVGFPDSELPIGTYQIRVLSKKTGTDTFYDCFDADKYYIQAVVTKSTITFTTVSPTVSLSASDITLTTDGIVNTIQTVTAKITNNRDAYHGTVYMFVDGVKVSGNGLSVEAGEKAMAYFSFKPTTVGTKTIKITSDEYGNDEIGTGSITIVNAAAAQGVSFTDKLYIDVDFESLNNADMNTLTVDGDKNVNVMLYGQSTGMSFSIINRSSANVTDVIIVIAEYNEDSGQYENPNSWVSFGDFVFPVNMSVGSSMELAATHYGKYEVRVYSGDRTPDNLLDNHFHFELTKGYAIWNSVGEKVTIPVSGNAPIINEDVFSAEIDGTMFTDVTPNTNPNTLYVITNGAAPTSLSGKNVITGTTAATINLVDGENNGFSTSIDFTASQINYSRNISTGTDGLGSGWTTIILPFDVEEVWAVDNKGSEQIDWFHNADQTNGRFWVRKFVNDAADNVIFDFADRIEANTPYLIAVPGSKWGTQWDLTGKTLVFKATNRSVSAGAKTSVTGDSYKFTGTTQSQSLSDVYVLNASGSTFVKSTGTVAPFRAYFKSMTLSKVSSLKITSPSNQTTAIGQLPAEIATPTRGAIYTLDGRRLKTAPEHGVYIMNGKKVVK